MPLPKTECILPSAQARARPSLHSSAKGCCGTGTPAWCVGRGCVHRVTAEVRGRTRAVPEPLWSTKALSTDPKRASSSIRSPGRLGDSGPITARSALEQPAPWPNASSYLPTDKPRSSPRDAAGFPAHKAQLPPCSLMIVIKRQFNSVPCFPLPW